jgi:predicted DNA-binding ribbon-helix-helix protein
VRQEGHTRREKRTVRKTVNLEPSVWTAIERLAARDGRSYSSVIGMSLKRDPSVQIFIERIGGLEGRN